MTVTVRLFAILRDRAGTSELALGLPPRATVADASAALARQAPALAAYLHRVAFAVNQSYVPAETILNDGDELAVIPPVSGG